MTAIRFSTIWGWKSPDADAVRSTEGAMHSTSYTFIRKLKRLSDGEEAEADLLELGVREDVAAVEEEGGLEHAVMDLLEVEILELVPLGKDGDGMGSVAGFHGTLDDEEVRVGSGAEDLGTNLFLPDLGIIDDDLGSFGEKVAADGDGGCLTGVVGVLLEGETKDADMLAVDGVEEVADDAAAESCLLPVVDLDHALPVGGDLGEAEVLAEVGEVQDVLLEAGTAVADGGLEELRSDAGVLADGAGDLVDVGTGGLAECGDGIDRGDALGEEGVGHELGKLGGPEVGGEDLLAGDPAGVNGDDFLDGSQPLGGLLSADEDAVGIVQILDGRSLGEELWIGEDLEGAVLGVGPEDGEHCLGGLHGNGALLDDDLGADGLLGDHAGCSLDVLQIGGASGTDSVGLGRGPDADEDDVGFADGLADVGGEEEVLPPGGFDNLLQAGLVNGKGVGIPSGDALLIGIADGDPDIGALGGDHGHGGTADITGAETADGGGHKLEG